MALGADLPDGRSYASEPLSEIAVGERVVRVNAPVEVRRMQDRQREGGGAPGNEMEEERGGQSPHGEILHIECLTMAKKPRETFDPTTKGKPPAVGNAARRAAVTKKRRASAIYRRLKAAYPDAKCALDHRSPIELLVATILSAQSTDKRVNMVTPALFAKYKTAADYARSPRGVLEREIHSTGFFNSKAKSIRAAGAAIAAEHGGRVPDTMEALTALPGVGRKTANVVLGNAFGKDEGFVVDTHIARLSHRLGFTGETDPVRIERDLIALVPKGRRTLFAHLLIAHGRTICGARKPLCGECPVEPRCPKVGVRIA
jgi:endonuclease III